MKTKEEIFKQAIQKYNSQVSDLNKFSFSNVEKELFINVISDQFKAEQESDAVRFAIWLNENRWFEYDKKTSKWCYTFQGGTSISKKAYETQFMKTSQELYSLYKQHK